MEHLAVANDVPLRQNREASSRKPRFLDIEFFVSFEEVGELSQVLVGHEVRRRNSVDSLLERLDECGYRELSPGIIDYRLSRGTLSSGIEFSL